MTHSEFFVTANEMERQLRADYTFTCKRLMEAAVTRDRLAERNHDLLGAIATALTWLTAQALAEDEDTALTEARRILREAVDGDRVAAGMKPVYRKKAT